MASRDPADLHPRLLVAWRILEHEARTGRLRDVERLFLTATYRSAEEQQKAYDAGRSRYDGTRHYSLHQFRPALAMDVCADPEGEDKASWESHLYVPLGAFCRQHSLGWGGWWRGLVDRPHIEIGRLERTTIVQTMLHALGLYGDPIDGAWGSGTATAMRTFQRRRGLEPTGTLHPPAWEALWTETHG